MEIQNSLLPRIGRTALAVCLSAAFCISFLPLSASADTLTSLEDQQSELAAQKQELQDRLNALGSSQEDALSRVTLLTEKLSATTQQIESVNAQLTELNDQITETQNELECAKMEQESYYTHYAARVRVMEESGSISYWEILFDATSFSDLIDRCTMVQEIVSYDKEILTQLEDIATTIAEDEAALDAEKEEAAQAAEQLNTYRSDLESDRAEAESALEAVTAELGSVSADLAALDSTGSDLAARIEEAKAALSEQVSAAQNASDSSPVPDASADSGAAADSSVPSDQGSSTSSQDEGSSTASQDTAPADTSSDTGSSESSTGSSEDSGSSSSSSNSSSSSSSGSSVLDVASRYLGCAYVWAGAGPDVFDCSGFTLYVFRQVGVDLVYHNAQLQYYMGTPVSRSDLQPGDLVFFSDSCSIDDITHVGIYVGGSTYINASSVAGCIAYSDLNSYWGSTHYVGACRVL